jgi:hypothetical protein
MVTVVSTPQGHKIIDQAIDAFIGDASGDAVVVFDYHSLTTGDYIYITSDIDEYNGFWYVEVASYREFQLREYEGADLVEYYQDADVEYYRTQPHDWSSIFLPIVYKITNDRWPINSADTARSINSQSDDNGFTQLDLSGALKVEVNILEFVKITGASDDDLNNIWQIVEVISTSSIVINLPYSVSNLFLGSLVQYYYNNYQVRVKVWAGLVSHPWEAKKPYEEMAELSLTPDEDNEVMFSISDYIKSKVNVKNNLTLFSLPLNLDAFTGFYIQTSESYDYSDNYALYTSGTSFGTDEFEGYAVAGKLPFKNTYSGDYAEYVYTSGSPARWLTNAVRLLMVEDLYFDISFIKNINGPFHVFIDKYVGESLNTTESIAYLDQGIGVYRIPITPNASFDSFCVHVETDTYEEEVEVPPPSFDLSEFLDSGSGDPWTTGALPFILNTHDSSVLYISFPTTSGTPYRFNYKFRVENASIGFKRIGIATLDAGVSGIAFELLPVVSDGIYEGHVILTPLANGLYVGFNNALSTVPFDWYVLEFSEGVPTTEMVEVEGVTVTEEICIDILETCEAQQGFSEEDRRLLEDGDFRLLE